jgi:hypothetical protein
VRARLTDGRMEGHGAANATLTSGEEFMIIPRSNWSLGRYISDVTFESNKRLRCLLH